MMIAENYPVIADMLKLYCHANAFDLEGLRKQVHRQKWLDINPTFRADFIKIIRGLMLGPDEYNRLTAIDLEAVEDVAEELETIFNFIYRDGPHP